MINVWLQSLKYLIVQPTNYRKIFLVSIEVRFGSMFKSRRRQILFYYFYRFKNRIEVGRQTQTSKLLNDHAKSG